MSEFTFLYRGRDTSASPEQMQKTIEKWLAWFKDLSAKGHIKNIGHPLEDTGKVVRGNHVRIGTGCEIDLVEYRDSFNAAEDAKVGERKRMEAAKAAE